MPALQNDPDNREALFSLEEKLTMQQLRFVGVRLWELLIRYDTASRNERLHPTEWVEWSTFIDAAYSCGVVCYDGGEDRGDLEKTLVPELMPRLEGDLELVDTLCPRDLRGILHYVMRSQRWGDGGAGTGGGADRGLITSRLGDTIALRLGT